MTTFKSEFILKAQRSIYLDDFLKAGWEIAGYLITRGISDDGFSDIKDTILVHNDLGASYPEQFINQSYHR